MSNLDLGGDLGRYRQGFVMGNEAYRAALISDAGLLKRDKVHDVAGKTLRLSRSSEEGLWHAS